MKNEIRKLIESGRENERMKIALKLEKRARHLLDSCSDADSPMLLVASELKIQAIEIYSQSD